MEDHFAQTRHGRIHWLESGVGEVLLLLHSNGCSAREYESVISQLASQFRVIAWDMPGHGDSDPITRHYTVEDYADAVVSLLDVLDLQRVWVAGASIGGLICVELGARHPTRIKGVVVVEALLKTEPEWKDQWHRIEATFGTEVQSFQEVSPRFRNLTPQVLERWNIDRSKASAWTMMDVMWSIRLYQASERIGAMKLPSAVIWGENGPVKSTIDRWTTLLPNSDCEMLADCGHFPMIDDPKAFVLTLLACLETLASK